MERTQNAKNKTKDMPINPVEREDLDREKGMEKKKATRENRSTGYREEGDAFDNTSDVKRMSDAEMKQGLKSETRKQFNPAQDEENH